MQQRGGAGMQGFCPSGKRAGHRAREARIDAPLAEVIHKPTTDDGYATTGTLASVPLWIRNPPFG